MSLFIKPKKHSINDYLYFPKHNTIITRQHKNTNINNRSFLQFAPLSTPNKTRVKNFQQIAALFKPSLELVLFFTGIRATVQYNINSLAVCFQKKYNKKNCISACNKYLNVIIYSGVHTFLLLMSTWDLSLSTLPSGLQSEILHANLLCSKDDFNYLRAILDEYVILVIKLQWHILVFPQLAQFEIQVSKTDIPFQNCLILGDPGAVSRAGIKGATKVFSDSHRTISKHRLPIGHEKCLVLLCPIGEQHLLISFCEFVHYSYWLDHCLSSSRTKEMHPVFSVSIMIIPIAYLFKYKQTLLELNSYQPYPSSERERKFCHCLSTSSKNIKFGIFTL